MRPIATAVSLLALIAAAPALAQAPAPAGPPPAVAPGVQVNQQDRDFVAKAARAGRAEIEMGRLAMRTATDPAVREFGRWMVTDHTAVNEALERLGGRLGITPPGGIAAEDQAALQQLERLSGRAFDQRYVALQLQDHRQAVALFQHEAEAGEQPVLKAVTEHSLPMLREHLAEAEELSRLPAIAAGPSTSGVGSSQPPARLAPNR